MSDTTRKTPQHNLAGSLWMVAAMAGFAIEDALLKSAATQLAISQILVFFGLGGAAIFAGFALTKGERLFTPAVLSRPMRYRVGFELVGRLFYVLAIAYSPLSMATVILQATPIVVVAGAALVFGESVGWQRWSAIVLGLLGVLIVVQPGSDSFTLLSLLAVIGMLGFAGRDLASRAAPSSISIVQLGFYGFLTIVIAGALFSCWETAALQIPDQHTFLSLIGAIVAGVAAYASLMTAMRTGEVSAVTPFRYTRLLFGIGLGVVFFNEQLRLTTLTGSALIVLSGVIIIHRSRHRKMAK